MINVVEAAPDVMRPFPGRQTAFIAAQYVDEVAFLGEKGPGKSHAFLLDALTYIDEPDYRALIIRKTYVGLRDIIDKSKRIYPRMGGVFTGGDVKIWTFPSGATIRFGYLAHYSDLDTYIGNEYQAIYFDEVGQIPIEWYKEMRSCLRTTNKKIKCKTRCASNPVGPYVLDYWTRFIDTLPEGKTGYFKYDDDSNDVPTTKDDPEAESRLWFRCLRTENPLINLKEYEKTLKGLSRKQKEAYLRGELILESAPDQLVPFEYIQNALNRPKEELRGFYILGVDVAGQGDDSTVLTFGRLHNILNIIQYKKKAPSELCEILMKYIEEYKGQILICIDAQGYGSALYMDMQRIMKKKHPKWASHIVGIGAKSENFDYKKKSQKYSLAMQFKGPRDFQWWETKTAFEENRINMSAVKKSPYLNMLMKEIGFITYSTDTGETVVITKKELRKEKKLGGSPDFADSLMYYIFGLKHYIQRLSDSHLREMREDMDYNSDKKETKTDVSIYNDPNWA